MLTLHRVGRSRRKLFGHGQSGDVFSCRLIRLQLLPKQKNYFQSRADVEDKKKQRQLGFMTRDIAAMKLRDAYREYRAWQKLAGSPDEDVTVESFFDWAKDEVK